MQRRSEVDAELRSWRRDLVRARALIEVGGEDVDDLKEAAALLRLRVNGLWLEAEELLRLHERILGSMLRLKGLLADPDAHRDAELA